MNQEFEDAIAELDQLKARFELELADWGKLTKVIAEWLETGQQISQSAVDAAERMQKTTERWDAIRELLMERLDSEVDAADWWKNCGEE